jgi:hypothetical protein
VINPRHEIRPQMFRLLSHFMLRNNGMHILADREHSFWRNVNAVSGFA